MNENKYILTETKSLITSVDNKYVNKFQDECNQKQQINQLSTYSFEKSTNDLINTTRNLINQNAFDLVLIELFKHICMIRGYVCSIINTLNQQIHHIIQNYQLINQSEIKLYSKSLNEISNICQSVEILINLNKKKFDHVQQFPIIVNLFFEFYENLKPIKVYGQVVNFDTGKPLENAKIDVWQYHPLTGYSVFGYNFRGYFLTDNQGKYEIETLIPVPYVSIRPSHIHVTVSSSGYYKLTTQLYVNPQIKTDFLNHFRPFPQHLILAVEQANKNDDIPQAKFTFRL
ncbi:unnamed protein product [Rotaria sordida]|uniref:Intradiol ring-cleavage dioxygenases domain-containing protein n=1 Tax=Rotaria sordida TaxID=392033 RepID=A0A814B912_9BILA|nr:unnamed protein product [Rotaria sordida]